jgi:hypothetical protein
MNCVPYKRVVHGIPAAPSVRLIGKGYQGDGHYGIKGFTTFGARNDYQKYPPSPEAFAAGKTQFQRWHSKFIFGAFSTYPALVLKQ